MDNPVARIHSDECGAWQPEEEKTANAKRRWAATKHTYGKNNLSPQPEQSQLKELSYHNNASHQTPNDVVLLLSVDERCSVT